MLRSISLIMRSIAFSITDKMEQGIHGAAVVAFPGYPANGSTGGTSGANEH